MSAGTKKAKQLCVHIRQMVAVFFAKCMKLVAVYTVREAEFVM